MKASDIDDVLVLRAVQDTATGQVGYMMASRWDVERALGSIYPEKVVLAKIRTLIRRGLLDGCPCGCRGDLTVVGDPRMYDYDGLRAIPALAQDIVRRQALEMAEPTIFERFMNERWT